MQEIVPEQSPQITKQLQSMGYGTLHRIPVVPRQDCVMSQCWNNVPLVIEKDGGEIVPGRIVWIEASGKWLHLEAHCCWRTPDGTVVDPTPKGDKEQVIAFVEEPLKWDGHLIASRYHCFTKDPAVVQFLKMIQQWQKTVSQLQEGEVHHLKELTPAEQDVYRSRTLAAQRLNGSMLSGLANDAIGNEGSTVRKGRQHVGRNETCPCGSGRKFKRCCGSAK